MWSVQPAASSAERLAKFLTVDISLRGWLVGQMFRTYTRVIDSRRLELLKALARNPNFEEGDQQDQDEPDYWTTISDSHIGDNDHGAMVGVSSGRQRVAERKCVCGQRHIRSSARTFHVTCNDPNCSAGTRGYFVTTRCIGISRLEYRRKGDEWKCPSCQPAQENPPEADVVMAAADAGA
jgi:hypothetical protein